MTEPTNGQAVLASPVLLPTTPQPTLEVVIWQGERAPLYEVTLRFNDAALLPTDILKTLKGHRKLAGVPQKQRGDMLTLFAVLLFGSAEPRPSPNAIVP